MFGYTANLVVGPEFKTQELCEKAAATIKAEADARVMFNNRQTPFCVKIEK